MIDAEQSELNAYAKFRERFLMEVFPKVYQRMQKDGTLAEHLEETAREAKDLFDQISGEMQSQVNRTPGSWEETVAKLEAIPVTVSEIVQAEVLLMPPS